MEGSEALEVSLVCKKVVDLGISAFTPAMNPLFT